MVHFGLLESRHVVTDSVLLYQVGKAGRRELEIRGEAPLPYLHAIDLKNFEHDRRVTDARIGFEARGATGWQSERQIREARRFGGGGGHMPDALFTLGQNACALEMELSLKNQGRYPQIFAQYQKEHDRIDAVLYLCGSVTVRDTILRLAGDAKRYYFALWDDWKQLGAETVFANRHDRVTLQEIA